MLSTTTPSPTAPRDAGSLLAVVRRCTDLRSKAGLRHWLQSEVQAFVPHAFMVVAWGNLGAGGVSHEVISAHPTFDAAFGRQVAGQVRTLFGRWLAAEGTPVTLSAEDLLQPAMGRAWPHDVCSVLAHGLTDRRGAYDCLYAFFGPEALCGERSMDASRILLPFIDAAFRQLTITVEPEDAQDALAAFAFPSVPTIQVRPAANEHEQDLSARELEVMKWVRLGKTNSEIGTILNLSTFTVKNHMRRIYRKLDVLNRAQAVGCLKRAEAVR